MQRPGFMRMLASAPIVAAIAITASAGAYAQVTTGTIRGVVRDDAGNPLKNVTVYLTPAAGESLTSVTDKNGAYVFLGVQPGTYKIHAELETFKTSEDQSLTITQDVVSTVDVALSKTVTQTGSTTVKVAPVRRGQSSDQSNVSARLEQQIKSQPNDLYQFPGLVFGQPGVTYDNGGYVHLKGGDYNQVGFQVDGVPITEPLLNGFATNIVTVGLKSASVLTGGADASFGGAGSGFINEVTQNGRDVKGGTIEYTAGPGNGWNYNGTSLNYGNVTSSGKFDYYLGTILFQNKFPANTQISQVKPSQDVLGKFNYYIDNKNTVTAFLSSGREKYDNYEPPLDAGSEYPVYDINTGKLTYTTKFYQDYADQRYDFHYFNYKHSFSDTSFANFKLYQVTNRYISPEAGGSQTYIDIRTKQTGYTADYTNQFSHNYQLKAGVQYISGDALRHNIQSIPTDSSQVDTDPESPTYGLINLTTGLLDRAYKTKPNTTTLYLSNQYRALEDKLTFDAGLRWSQMKYNLTQVDFSNYIIPQVNLDYASTLPNGSGYDIPGSHSVHYLDPRFGVSYSPNTSLVFRTSYSVNSQFPDAQFVEQLPGFLVGYPVTSRDTTAQVNRFLRNYVPYNALQTEHTNAVDLGFEKGFAVNKSYLTGSWAIGGDIFRRVSYNLIQQEMPNYANYGFYLSSSDYTQNGRPYAYNSEGTMHSSGYDITLSKKLVKKTDWNGFFTYNNLTAKGTSSYYDTGYLPYYITYLSGTPGLDDAAFRNLINSNEVPTTWNQTHAVSIVANKQIWKWFDTTVFMDAGSGFPFSPGTLPTNDAQHANFSTDGANFNQVPIVVAGSTLQPNNPVPGYTGWHYKFTLNSNFHISDNKTLFLNIDNIFNRRTTIVESTAPLIGLPFYHAPDAQYPQGRVYYGSNTVITPRFLSFGFRVKF